MDDFLRNYNNVFNFFFKVLNLTINEQGGFGVWGLGFGVWG
jgi:hypothetical protein